MSNVLLLFSEIKETYFPDWDPANLWAVQLKSQLSDGYLGNAYCNRKTKVIEIYELFNPIDDNVMRCLIAHQLCHAIEGTNHTRKWASRFLEVAKTADLTGRKPLADLIWADAGASWDRCEPNIHPILQNIQVNLSEQPDETKENIIDSAALAMGINSADLLMRYPAVETYYNTLKQALKEKGQDGENSRFWRMADNR